VKHFLPDLPSLRDKQQVKRGWLAEICKPVPSKDWVSQEKTGSENNHVHE
jgi:hypothetical protein